MKTKTVYFVLDRRQGEDNVFQNPKLYSLVTCMPYIGYMRNIRHIDSGSRYLRMVRTTMIFGDRATGDTPARDTRI